MTKIFKKTKYYILEMVLLIITVIEFYPVFIIVSDSFKTRKELAENPFGFPTYFVIDNIMNALIKMKFYKSLLNSFVISASSITLIIIIIIIIIAAMAAYPISRRKSNLFIRRLFNRDQIKPCIWGKKDSIY